MGDYEQRMFEAGVNIKGTKSQELQAALLTRLDTIQADDTIVFRVVSKEDLVEKVKELIHILILGVFST